MNQIKTVFVGLFYSAIVPTGLIVTAVAMVMLYWVDKYSLLRLWKRPPVREAESGSAEKLLLYHIWHPSEARSSLFVRACVAAACMTVAEAVAMLLMLALPRYSVQQAYDARLSSYSRKYVIICIWLHLVMARIFFAK